MPPSALGSKAWTFARERAIMMASVVSGTSAAHGGQVGLGTTPLRGHGPEAPFHFSISRAVCLPICFFLCCCAVAAGGGGQIMLRSMAQAWSLCDCAIRGRCAFRDTLY
eukprot:scaffold53665_cov59-Attheya_sp.AAC.10